MEQPRGLRRARFPVFGTPLLRAIQWRIVPRYERLLIQLARLYRYALAKVVFVGVTGSCGKSTTSELIAAVLSAGGEVATNSGNANQPGQIARLLLRLRPWLRYCVVELTPVGYKIKLDFSVPLRLVRPRIGVVTNVGSDHIDLFRSQDAIAEAKGGLIEALPANGVAILNADDPRVLGMRDRCRGAVMTYGLSEAAMVRAEDVCSRWPARLSFTVHYQRERRRIETQLCGEHWVHAALAAIATGLAAKRPLSEIADRLRSIPPLDGRFSPVRTAAGVTFIRDDYKAPLWSVAPALEFMRDASAERKIAILGTISDYTLDSNTSRTKQRTYVSVAEQALDVADHVIFVGEQASKCLRARRNGREDRLRAFYSVQAARQYLSELLQAGDLVLLKGSSRQDRLAEIVGIVSNRTTNGARVSAPGSGKAHEAMAQRDALSYAVVGVGNSEDRFRGTRHNVGQLVLDRLAETSGAVWEQIGYGWVAELERDGKRIVLVKPTGEVNSCGPVIRELAHWVHSRPEQVVLVHDDVQLPVGTVRSRVSGGHGGHQGVRSILDALETDQVRRVKIGVGRPDDMSQLSRYVVSAFTPEEFPLIDQACARAAAQIWRLIALAGGSARR